MMIGEALLDAYINANILFLAWHLLYGFLFVAPCPGSD